MWPSAKVRNRFDGYHRVNATYLHYLKTTLGECEEDDTNQHAEHGVVVAAGGSIFFVRGGGL